MWQALLINALLKVASDVLITFLNRGVEELQKRKDNDFYEQGDSVKEVINKIKVYSK